MIKRVISKLIKSAGLRRFSDSVSHAEKAILQARDNQIGQLQLQMHYRRLSSLRDQLPRFNDTGFRVYSQFEEDGLLLYIFSLIGTTNKRVVEICAGVGWECMAANLIVNHGWDGLLFDGGPENVQRGTEFYRRHPNTSLKPPKFVHAWITAKNINDLISKEDFAGEVDLLSLDIDGNDYWIWKAIDVIRPRVCLFETHNVIPLPLSLTVPYEPSRCALSLPEPESDFRSVSLAAMTKLSKSKGYRLVGAHRLGFNVFYMRNDVAADIFPEIPETAVHDNEFTRHQQKDRWPGVKNFPWCSV